MAIKETIEEIENIEIDITDTSLAEGMEQEMDLKEDWQARACPPPAGKYRLKLFLEKTDFEQGRKQGFQKDDSNGYYYKAQVTGKIQDPTGVWQDSIVYYNASTGMQKGKKVSTMAGLLVMMGDTKLPSKISEKALALRFYNVINKNQPVLLAECDWSTWDREDKSGGDFGTSLLVGMKLYPKKADGTYQHIIKNKKGVEFVAKLKLIKWLGKAGTPTTAAPVAAPKPPVQEMKVVSAPVAEKQEELTFSDDGEVQLED